MLLAEEFAPLLAPFNLEALDRDPSTIYGMWPDLRIAFANATYVSNAAGGFTRWGLGAQSMDAIGALLTPFYRDFTARALATRKVQVHRYECPTPEQRRQFELRLHPLGESEGLLAVHSLLVAEEWPPTEVTRGAYFDGEGIVVVCMHCRRARHRVLEQWDMVPEFLQSVPTVSHGLCPLCQAYHYPDG